MLTLHMLLPGIKRDLVKMMSSGVQAGNVSTLRSSAMDHLTAGIAVMRMSTGSNEHKFHVEDMLVDK